MGFFDRKHEKESPIGNLRAHIGAYLYFVEVGRSKFKGKGRVYDIFYDMHNTKFLFDQATRGTMYDYRKRLDYALWDAAVHKYQEDMESLKKELLKAVDEGEAAGKNFDEEEEEKKRAEEEARKKEEEEAKEKSGDWRKNLKGQMAEAEEKAKAEEEEKKREAEEPPKPEAAAMTEADCRELWRIIQGLEREFKEMQKIADDWFAVHGKGNGCLGAFAAMALVPVGIAYAVWMVL